MDRTRAMGVTALVAAVAIPFGCGGGGSRTPPAITVVSPNGDETWVVGSTATVAWETTGTVGNLLIELSTDGGGTWTTLVIASNDGTEPVTVPDMPSNTCWVRVSELDDNPSDMSDADFTIEPAPAITVTSPNGGEIWLIGSRATVTWDTEGTVGDVRIDLSGDGGSTWPTTLAASAANDGAETVTVPNTPGSECRVKVSELDGSPSDTSDAGFTIMPQFTDIGAGLPPVEGAVAWGDHDNDGDLDLALAGMDSGSVLYTDVYVNNAGSFGPAGASLTKVKYPSLAWSDYDNDGDIDLAVSGMTAAAPDAVRIYSNASGVLTDSGAILTSLVGVLAWGDYDNDGDTDLVVAGENSAWERIARLYRNQGSGVFTDAGAGLTGVKWCGLACGDYDNDGDMDLLLAGMDATDTRLCALYRNDGGALAQVSSPFVAVCGSSLSWGDYDNDGDLDLALAGNDGAAPFVSRIYGNDGAGTYTDISAPLVPVEWCSVAWGDYDNDGDLDLALMGGTSPYVTKVYRNDGADTFVDTQADLRGGMGRLAWGDYDGDGDLDLAVSGKDDWVGNPFAAIYCNNCLTPNTRAAAPSGLSATVSGADVIFSWNPATDAETPSPGLTYNLRVGTETDRDNVMPGMSVIGGSSDDGKRLIPAMGNVQLNTSWTVKGLPAGTYYWSVQAVDTGFVGSPWADEQTTVVLP